MTGHDLDPIAGARQAVATSCAEIAPVVMWAYLDGVVKEYDALAAKLAVAEQERDSAQAQLVEARQARNENRAGWDHCSKLLQGNAMRTTQANRALAAVREVRDKLARDVPAVEQPEALAVAAHSLFIAGRLTAALAAAAEQDEPNESIVCMEYPNCDRQHAGGAGGVPVHPPAGSRVSGCDGPLIPFEPKREQS